MYTRVRRIKPSSFCAVDSAVDKGNKVGHIANLQTLGTRWLGSQISTYEHKGKSQKDLFFARLTVEKGNKVGQKMSHFDAIAFWYAGKS